ncbi:uncharacterized protein JN550_006435 [Neoarthrinium moseri]|uniref:uncharacterized protein n=1 Tax=Neoarthrinium moseri TaxID=1658444 RepID=UPI001FDE26EE|nr:uncharacterized protein JN550_006435 [Neoarthrinium moseri]KAI1868519.1 hypothetical protein JN550_006435 [Neoarthrinium moseri]
METLMALWRGHPKVAQPPTTEASSESSRPGAQEPAQTSRARSDGAAMPPPPPPTISPPEDTTAASPQTTPKAKSASTSGAVPSLSLSASPPASAAAQARVTDASPALAPPSLSTAPIATPSTLMPPPPRPPTLNSINNSSSSSNRAPSHLSPAPARGLPNSLASSARQPGTSTLAPPPTHSARPSKPSRKVVLEPGHSPLDWARLANGPASDLRNLGPGAPYLKVTPSMLKRQTGRRGKDAWTALGGRVYNISPYLPFHPGGEPELLRCAGRDGTKLFGEIHPWVNYEGMLASSLIGMLVEEGEETGNGAMDEMD